MRTFHLSFLIALVTIPALITDASAHFRGHSHHHHLNRRGAIPTPEARLRQPIEFFQVFPDSSFTMGIGGAVLVDPGVHGLDQRLDQGLGVDLNLGVRLNHYVSLHLASLATLHPAPQAPRDADPGLLTEVSFDTCLQKKPDSTLSAGERACIHTVVGKYLDTSEFVLGRSTKKAQQSQMLS